MFSINFHITTATTVPSAAHVSSIYIQASTINVSRLATYSVCPSLTLDYWKNFPSAFVAGSIKE
jgi:hypothetical protein